MPLVSSMMMTAVSSCVLVVLAVLVRVTSVEASAGDSNPLYRSCVESCEQTGCIGGVCFPSCSFPVNGVNLNSKDENPLLEEPLYVRWKKWDCTSKCRYQCMVQRETVRSGLGERPVKYHGKWPFKNILGMQEPASVAFSVLNLLAHFQGLSSFLVLIYYKLPLRPSGSKGPYYDFAGLWTIYGLLSINSWFWSAIFHSRDMLLTERLDYSSAIALLGCSLIVALIRTFNLRIEAARVMVSAPFIAFIATHILYLNFYDFDYGWNMKVCVVLGVVQLITWTFWAGFTKHPARLKLWISCIGAGLAMLLEIYDFPPVKGILDAHAVWHAVTIPLTLMWWSFIRDDATHRTSVLSSRAHTAARKMQ